jgi:hypothetical protein
MFWQTLIDPRRGALCGDEVMPSFGRPADQHSNKTAYLGIRRS